MGRLLWLIVIMASAVALIAMARGEFALAQKALIAAVLGVVLMQRGAQ